MGRKIRLTESSLRTIVSESVRRVLNEIKGPSDDVPRSETARQLTWASPTRKQSESFVNLGNEYVRRGLEKSHLRDRWNAKYGEIGEMTPKGFIYLRNDWAKRLGCDVLSVTWFGNTADDFQLAAKMRRKLAEWDANGVLPKGAVMLLNKIQDYI